MTAILQAVRLRDWKGASSAAVCNMGPQAIRGRQAKVNWAELIERIGTQQDREAFKVLFEHFAPRIKSFLLRHNCNADEAEEIAQNTLIAVWRKADQFDPATTGAAAWIFTIARNLRIDGVRRAVRVGRFMQSVELEFQPEPVCVSRRWASVPLAVSCGDSADNGLNTLAQEKSKACQPSTGATRPAYSAAQRAPPAIHSCPFASPT